jgi:hypothetical protein
MATDLGDQAHILAIIERLTSIEEQIVSKEESAIATVDELVARLSDRETVVEIVAVWKSVLDEAIGSGVRRTIYIVLIALIGVIAVKLDVIGWSK